MTVQREEAGPERMVMSANVTSDLLRKKAGNWILMAAV